MEPIPEGETVLTIYDSPPAAASGAIVPDAPSPAPAAAPVSAVVETPTAAPVVAEPVVSPVATTEQPAAPSADDLGKLMNSAGGGSAGIILALIAVVGGGAAWKTYQKFSEQRHEQAMKKMDIDAKAQGLAGAQPPPCQVKQVEVDAKLAAFETRIAATEKKSAALSADFDGDDIERRVKKLEKVVKALGEGT